MPHLRGGLVGYAAAGVAYSVVLLVFGGGHRPYLVDIGLAGFSVFAGAAAAVAAFRSRGRRRVAWLAMALGTWAWGAGGLGSVLVHVTTGMRPAVSWTDAGHFAFLAGAAVCLGCLVSTTQLRTQTRVPLDGLIVGAALFGVGWLVLTGAGDPGRFDLVLTLALPVADCALLTIAAVLLAGTPAGRRDRLGWLVAGFALFAVSDIARVFLTAAGGEDHRQLLAIGWVWGLLCIGTAASVARSTDARGAADVSAAPVRFAVWLLGVPLVLAVVLCTPIVFDGLAPVFIAAAVAVVAALLRQVLVLADNRRLRTEVADGALHDPLTGLPNRTLFRDRLTQALQRRSGDVSELVVDLDDFRVVNETYGDRAGDTLLIQVAQRVRSALRPGDTVARVGGDVFAVILTGESEAARETAEDVIEAFERPFGVGGQELRMRVGAGMATGDASERLSADELHQRAEIALEAAKHARTGRLFFYTASMESGQPVTPRGGGDVVAGSAQLLADLRSAIEQSELRAVYQPKFDLTTNRIVGLEALTRWPHPRRGVLVPAQFLPLVRRHGLMRSLTSAMLSEALDDAARWYERGVGVPVAVNVFAPAIADCGLYEQLTRALEERGLPPDCLTIEVTEDLLLENLVQTKAVFQELRARGIRVAIDDFGSGYSALWYLREFPVDELKLDRDFIAPVLTHPASAAIAEAVIGLAHSLGVTPVAEGVENAETAARLRDFGCRVAQGFHFSAPLPATEIHKLLHDQTAGPTDVRNLRAPGAARSS
ncbi:putative bifunctional diguanylate cyclase/phosphodiesterase [Mycolicibacterium vaccae]|uniref:putative bifunctional diguanylate cyclase/phosphodiesterase n=1 Tax=Mycolicibacterium vaccae TaxID=1810 RepID=UPI003CFABDB6